MENLEKSVFSFLLTIGVIWMGQWTLLWLADIISGGIYLEDSILFLFPPILTVGAFIYFWRKKKKAIAISLLVGGCIYSLGFMFSFFWGLGESLCTRYFFDLLTTCP